MFITIVCTAHKSTNHICLIIRPLLAIKTMVLWFAASSFVSQVRSCMFNLFNFINTIVNSSTFLVATVRGIQSWWRGGCLIWTVLSKRLKYLKIKVLILFSSDCSYNVSFLIVPIIVYYLKTSRFKELAHNSRRGKKCLGMKCI